MKIQTTLVSEADIIQFFTSSKSDLELNFKTLIKALKDDGSLWISYPKGTSKMETDINRDIIWKIGKGVGLKPVAMISIDPEWAGFRLKKPSKRLIRQTITLGGIRNCIVKHEYLQLLLASEMVFYQARDHAQHAPISETNTVPGISKDLFCQPFRNDLRFFGDNGKNTF